MDSRKLRAWRIRIFVLSWVTYAAYYMGRVNLAVAMPAIQAEFQWSKASVGLIGSALYWVYAIGQLVNGHLGDRLSARKLVAIGLAVSALLNLLFGTLGSLAMMTVVWALNGWAQSTGWGPLMKTLSRWFEPSQRGKLTALFTPCYVVGHALSWALAGWLVATRGWRYGFWVPGVILLVFALSWYLLARDGPDQVASETFGNPQPPKTRPRPARFNPIHGLASAIRRPEIRWALIACFLSGMVKDGLTLWGPTYLMEEQGLDLAAAALTGVSIPVAGALGAMISGWLMHRASAGREPPIVAGLAILIATAALGLYWLGIDGQRGTASTLIGGAGMLAALALGSHGMNALLMTSLPLSLGPRGNVSSAAGTLDFASYVGGGLSAALVGGLQDLFGWGGVFAWWAAVALAITVLALSQRSRPKRQT